MSIIRVLRDMVDKKRGTTRGKFTVGRIIGLIFVLSRRNKKLDGV